MNHLNSLSSGIEGQVSFGPISPLTRPGMLNYRPYQATITVLDEEGRTVTQFQSDEDGHFRIILEPGRYTFHPESPGTHPRAAKQTIRVSEGKFTQVRINYDSGIR